MFYLLAMLPALESWLASVRRFGALARTESVRLRAVVVASDLGKTHVQCASLAFWLIVGSVVPVAIAIAITVGQKLVRRLLHVSFAAMPGVIARHGAMICGVDLVGRLCPNES